MQLFNDVTDSIILTTAVGAFIGLVVWFRFFANLKKGASMAVDGGREASLLEFCWVETMEKFGINQICNVAFVESKVPVTEKVVEKAAYMTRAHHPLLRMRFSDLVDSHGKTRHCFVPMEKDLVDVRTVEGDDWQAMLQVELTTRLDMRRGPLWRIRVMRSIQDHGSDGGGAYGTTMLISFAHSIADGNTTKRFIDELLTNMSLVADGEETLPESYPLPRDPLDILGIKELTWWEWIGFRIMFALMPFLLRFQKQNPFIARFGTEISRDSKVHRATRIIPIEFSREMTAKIRHVGKKYNATMNGVLSAAAAVAIAEMMQGGSLASKQNVATKVAVSLRRFCDPPLDPAKVFALFIGMLPATFRVPQDARQPEAFFKLAADATRESHSKINGGSVHWFLKLMLFVNLQQYSIKEISSMFAPMSSTGDNRVADLFFVSNLGNLDYFTKEVPRPFELTGVYSVAEATETGELFNHNICTLHGRLNWTLVYVSHVTSRETAQRYADLIVDILTQMCDA